MGKTRLPPRSFRDEDLTTEAEAQQFINTAITGHLDEFHGGGNGSNLPIGWKDNVITLNAGNTGNPNKSPLFADSGNGIWGYCFSDENKNFAFADFHINHDYKIGTKIYPHIHWVPMSYSTGDVRWVIEYTFAKGHQQGDVLTGVTNSIVLTAPGKGLIGEHMLTECSEVQAFTVQEPDTIVRIRLYRDGAHVDDTFYGGVLAIMLDFHYESDRESTPQKEPDFYVENS